VEMATRFLILLGLCLALIALFAQPTHAEVSQDSDSSSLNVEDPYGGGGGGGSKPKTPKPKTTKPKTTKPKTTKPKTTKPKASHTPKTKKPTKPVVKKPTPVHDGPTPVTSSRCNGVCQDNSLDCSGTYMSGLCPGASNIQCCPASTDYDGDGSDDSSSGGALSLDQAGINLIKGFEGWSSCYYKDVAGYGTIGYGHLVKSGDPYKSGTCISEQDGENLLASDAQSFVDCVNGLGASLNQNQFDALVSFSYNLGCGALSSIKTLLQQGNYGAVCGKMEQYTHAGGKVVQGLVNRRKSECNMFNS